MVYFQTQNKNLGKFWKVLQWKMFGIFGAILSILRTNSIFYGILHFVVMWYIFTRFGMLYREKSGNPDQNHLKPAIKSASRQSDRFFRIQMQHLCGGLG
jgi:hypothetical protein